MRSAFRLKWQKDIINNLPSVGKSRLSCRCQPTCYLHQQHSLAPPRDLSPLPKKQYKNRFPRVPVAYGEIKQKWALSYPLMKIFLREARKNDGNQQSNSFIIEYLSRVRGFNRRSVLARNNWTRMNCLNETKHKIIKARRKTLCGKKPTVNIWLDQGFSGTGQLR